MCESVCSGKVKGSLCKSVLLNFRVRGFHLVFFEHESRNGRLLAAELEILPACSGVKPKGKHVFQCEFMREQLEFV